MELRDRKSSIEAKASTPETDNRFSGHDPDLPGKANLFPIWYDLPHVAG